MLPNLWNKLVPELRFAVSVEENMEKGIQANVDRWMKQFEDPQDKKVNTETINKTRVTYAQAHGTFLSGRPFGPKTPNPGYGLLAAIIEGEGGAVFIKITGPKAAVEANIAATKKMVTASLTR